MYMRKLLLINLLLMSVLLMQAQTYCGLHKYDGEHKNEVSGYMMGGSNVVSDAFFGFEGSYLRHLTDRWHVGGDMQFQFGKPVRRRSSCLISSLSGKLTLSSAAMCISGTSRRSEVFIT